MKKVLTIIACLLSMAACTPIPGTPPAPASKDSVFSGSYFSIQFDSAAMTSQDVTWGGRQIVSVSALRDSIDTAHRHILIKVRSNYGVYNIHWADIDLIAKKVRVPSDTVDTFFFTSMGSWYKRQSVIGLYSPGVEYTDSFGTAYLSHNDSDFIEGHFNTVLYTQPSESDTTNGYFKVYLK
jgi:hypothetical protein